MKPLTITVQPTSLDGLRYDLTIDDAIWRDCDALEVLEHCEYYVRDFIAPGADGSRGGIESAE